MLASTMMLSSSQAKHIVLCSWACVDAEDCILSKQFMPIERYLKRSGLPSTIIRLPLFFDNNLRHLSTIIDQGKIYGPCSPDARYSAISISDSGLAVATVLNSPLSHKDKVYQLSAQPVTGKELAAAFGAALGKRVDYVQVPNDAFRMSLISKHIPEWEADGILEVYKMIDEGSPFAVYPDQFVDLIGHSPMNISEWIVTTVGTTV